MTVRETFRSAAWRRRETPAVPILSLIMKASGLWLAVLTGCVVAPVASSPLTVDTVEASSTCSTRLQTLIDSAAAGSVLQVPACVYRELVSVNKALTLDGEGKAQVRGSDVWTHWTLAGSTWTSRASVPNLPQHGQCTVGTQCQLPEQVFFDGRPLSRTTSSTPLSGQFALSSSRNVVLADNPAGHTVEVTTRNSWLEINADGVTVQGFTMRHAADIGLTVCCGARNVVIQNNVLAQAHYADVQADSGMNLLGNDIGFGGCLGVSGSPQLLQGNKIHNNNTEGFDRGWEAGGVKTAFTTGAVWDNNDVYDNDGVGLWSDIHGDSMTISNNRIHDNSYHGILYELSINGKIYGNSIWSNGAAYPYFGGGAGIFVTTSQNVEVRDNLLAWNGSGIAVWSWDRGPEFPWGQNYVHNNSIILGKDTYGLEFIGTRVDDRGDHNAYWYPTPENGRARFTYAQNNYSQLSAFVAGPGDSVGRYLSDGEKSNLLSVAGMPPAP